MIEVHKASWKPRVVIVDDSRTVQAMLEQIFINRLGCEIAGIAGSAEEAMQMVRSMRPDIVTIDIRMPGRDGLGLLDDLRDEHYARKIVVASEISADIPLWTQVIELGANAAFDKRVFTGRPGYFCVKMREIILGLRCGVQPEAGSIAQQPAGNPDNGFGNYPVHAQEIERVKFLSDAGLANADRDPVLDGITRYMSSATGFPICLLTMIDSQVQWVKAAYGAEVEWTPRAEAFCTYTICDEALLAVPNAATDPRFEHNPLVIGAPGVRCYFGYPVISPTGVRLGALCLVDLRPRKLSQAQEDNLRGMAAIVTALIGERCNA